MTDELDADFLADMLHFAKAAVRLLGSADADQLRGDEKTYLAVQHAIQTFGEAANRISDAGKRELPGIPWQDIIGMRHRIVHGYAYVRPELLVDVVRVHLPSLIDVLERAQKDETR